MRWVTRWLNLILWLASCALAGTGLLLAWRLPPGSRGGAGLTVLSWTRHDWGDLHFWLGLAVLALGVAHLALHWRWLWQAAARRRAWGLLAGLGVGVLVIVVLLLLPVGQGQRGGGQRKHGQLPTSLEQDALRRGGDAGVFLT